MADDPKSEFYAFAAVRLDRMAEKLADRAYSAWYLPLCRERWHLPFYLVADLGVLLLRREADLTDFGKNDVGYVSLLREIAIDDHFKHCAKVVENAHLRLQDETIRTAIQAMTRQIRAALITEKIKPVVPKCLPLVNDQLRSAFNAKRHGGWIRPPDMIAIRAASRLSKGAMLLDHRLLDECLGDWSPVPYHPLKTRRIPTRIIGTRDVSRRQGNIVGFTGVRPRLPADPLVEVLPSEWALMRLDPKQGLDKILNRQALVYCKESPHDLIPKLRVLIAFIIEADAGQFSQRAVQSLPQFVNQARQLDSVVHAKALTYRMILDASEQVPFDIMTVHIAVYLMQFREGQRLAANCFDLQQIRPTEDPTAQLIDYDEFLPSYFYHSDFRSVDGRVLRGPWPEMAENPYVFLAGASASVSTYTATLAVLFSQPGRWPAVLAGSAVQLRPVEVGRPTTLLVETTTANSHRIYGWRSFQSLAQASVGYTTPVHVSSDVDVRNAFLNMLLGPKGTMVSSLVGGQMAVD
jgi:hypothetical protein